MRARLCPVVFLAALAALVLPLRAEHRAVLVGVSDYSVLDADLNGPKNDVRLMAEVLAARGVPPAEMTVLTSDPSGLPAGARSGPPTRAAIMAALADVSARANPGDTVVFYFSGHGAQAPDQSGDEGGGYDEIFLPADEDKMDELTQIVEKMLDEMTCCGDCGACDVADCADRE